MQGRRQHLEGARMAEIWTQQFALIQISAGLGSGNAPGCGNCSPREKVYLQSGRTRLSGWQCPSQGRVYAVLLFLQLSERSCSQGTEAGFRPLRTGVFNTYVRYRVFDFIFKGEKGRTKTFVCEGENTRACEKKPHGLKRSDGVSVDDGFQFA